MSAINVILLIILLATTISLTIRMLYTTNLSNLNNTKDKLIDSENECFQKYKNKYDYIIKMIQIVENKYKVSSKIFEDAKEIKIDSIDSFKSEKIFNKCFKEIMHIKEDNIKIKETKAFRELIDNYNSNELDLISLRTYHNKYTLIYNNMIKKFPYNIISKIKKYNVDSLIEGTEIDINFNNDLEV